MAKLQTIQADDIKSGSKTVTETTVQDGKSVTKTRKVKKPPESRISHHRGHGTQSGKVVVKKGGIVQYVSRKIGDMMVAKDGWSYGKKSEWRARDVVGVVEVKAAE